MTSRDAAAAAATAASGAPLQAARMTVTVMTDMTKDAGHFS